ncbi:fosfomycin resistance glutathione transferase [Vibrio sonorensis]|uniref:fosfomycin resistance glutathione transferase n=1 Tax=Vibrio sonorensis TaxID=1004316 RepID=UPI0008D98384|nr:fosfomycin resistance glutathione transferase [Vibrio sonorensis]
MLKGINHITIAVSDLDASLHFYQNVLGMTGHVRWAAGAYLTVGEQWFCLSIDDPNPAKDYTHIAFDVEKADFLKMKERLDRHSVKEWKVNSSEGESIYILDPDGHKLEIHVGSLQTRLDQLKDLPYKDLQWL